MKALKRAVLGIAALGATALWFGQAKAEPSFFIATTEDLYALCTTPRDDPQRQEAINYCVAYLDGVVDYHDAVSAHEDLKPLICYPDRSTLEQGVLVFIRWAEERQNDTMVMDEIPVIGVVRALASEWPCES